MTLVGRGLWPGVSAGCLSVFMLTNENKTEQKGMNTEHEQLTAAGQNCPRHTLRYITSPYSSGLKASYKSHTDKSWHHDVWHTLSEVYRYTTWSDGSAPADCYTSLSLNSVIPGFFSHHITFQPFRLTGYCLINQTTNWKCRFCGWLTRQCVSVCVFGSDLTLTLQDYCLLSMRSLHAS